MLIPDRLYMRAELAKELGEDASALTDKELAQRASEKFEMKVSFLPGFVPPFLVQRRKH